MPNFRNSLCVIPEKAPSVGSILVFITERVVAGSIFSLIFHFLSILSLNLTLLHPSLFALLPFALLSWCTFFCPLLELLVILLRALQYWSCFWALVHSAGTSTTQHTHTQLQSPCSSVSTCLPLLTAPPEVTRSRLSQSHAGDLQRFKYHIWLPTAVSVFWKHRGWSRGHWFLLLFKVHGTFTPGGSFDIPALNVLPESWIIDEWVPARRTLRVFQNLTLFHPATLLNVIGVLYTSSQLEMEGWMERDEMIEGLGHSSTHRFASPWEWILEMAVQS